MTGTFASWLVARSAGEIELAPGVVTPRTFGDARREHLATRRAGGLFDFSFMQCAQIRGAQAVECVEALQTRRLRTLAAGRIAYTLLLRDDGTVLNDATVWRLDHDRFLVFTGRRSDFAWVAEAAARLGVAADDASQAQAVIAVQGDTSRRAIEQCLGIGLSALPYFSFVGARFADARCSVARLGYSGETGYEIVIDEAAAPALWEALLGAGTGAALVECGFDATDSLRIEAGHVLFTRELAAPVTPFELGFRRLVEFAGRDFTGAAALRELRGRPPRRRLVGLLPVGEATATAFQPLPASLDDGTAVMTSVCFSPLFERRIGIGFAAATDCAPGSTVELIGAGRARVARLPFYDPPRVLPRRAG